MKISIITVCLNSEQTIVATLQSIASQTYQDIEHIIIDGGSTDQTVKYIKNNMTRIAYLKSEPDRGIYDAMNKGIRLASGDIIGILNSDDIYANNFVLERVAQVMLDGSFDAIYGDVEYISSSDITKTIRRYSSRFFSPSNLAWGWMPAHPTLFIRKTILDKYGLYQIDYKIAADFELVARIFKDGKIKHYYLPEIMVKMRIGGVSTSGIRNSILLNQEVFRACKSNAIHTNILMLLSKYPLKLMEYFRR